MRTCGCCETVGAYIGQHLDPGGTLTRADAYRAPELVTELDWILAAEGGAGITADELSEYCRGLDA